MGNPGDIYAVLLRDDGLRATLVAPETPGRSPRVVLIRSARSVLAAGLRALAVVVDAPLPPVAPDGSLPAVH